MRTRFTGLVLISLVLAVALPPLGQVPVAAAAETAAAAAPLPLTLSAPHDFLRLGDVIVASPLAITYYRYLPLVTKSLSCYTGQSYGSFPVPGGYDGIPAAQHPDKNLAVRGYVLDSGGGLGFTALGLGIQAHDPSAPQLPSLFSPAPTPPFAHVYRVYNWVWGPAPTYGSRGSLLGDTLLGITTTVGTQIRLPVRLPPGSNPVAEYPGGTFYYGMVIYAAPTRITIVYISWDSIVNQSGLGYGIQVEDVCVDPNLLALYNSLNAGGRGSLPALQYNQAFGVATGTEIKVAVRDSGQFMDPRSQQDWWVP